MTLVLIRPITPTIAIGDQPSAAELQSLPVEGYVAIVNLRNDGEPDQPLSTAAEGEQARSFGMQYHHYGVGGRPLDAASVQAVCDFIDQHSAAGKVLVHCRKGPRAAAIVLVQQARANGWSADEAIEHGATMGLAVDHNMRAMILPLLQGE